MRFSRKPQDAAGQALDPTAIYVVTQPYSQEHYTFNHASELLGAHEAVQAHPEWWVRKGTDLQELARLRAIATTPPSVSHKSPRPESIPLERRAVAAESFQDGRSGTYVRAGQVYDDRHAVVKANRHLFHRPAQSLGAA